jgi:hypothetical protein
MKLKIKLLSSIITFLPIATHAQQFVQVPYVFQAQTVANASQVMADFNSVINNGNAVAAALQTQISAVVPLPSGALVFFYLAACPSGWTQNTAWAGRFVRGLDLGAGNDPTVPAPKVMTTEAQGLLSHKHGNVSLLVSSNAVSIAFGGASNIYAPTGSEIIGGVGTNAAGSSTLVPANVGLIICKKN